LHGDANEYLHDKLHVSVELRRPVDVPIQAAEWDDCGAIRRDSDYAAWVDGADYVGESAGFSTQHGAAVFSRCPFDSKTPSTKEVANKKENLIDGYANIQ
jgi:hypothetical protein